MQAGWPITFATECVRISFYIVIRSIRIGNGCDWFNYINFAKFFPSFFLYSLNQIGIFLLHERKTCHRGTISKEKNLSVCKFSAIMVSLSVSFCNIFDYANPKKNMKFVSFYEIIPIVKPAITERISPEQNYKIVTTACLHIHLRLLNVFFFFHLANKGWYECLRKLIFKMSLILAHQLNDVNDRHHHHLDWGTEKCVSHSNWKTEIFQFH